MLFNNIFLCIWGNIFGLMRKFFKISIFNILTGQKQDMTELKLVWPVNMTGHCWQIILSPVTKNNTTSSPDFLGQRFNNLQRAALLMSFWRHWFNNLQQAALFDVIGSKFGQQQLVMENYACKVRLSLHSGQVAHQAGAYPGFRSMKRLRVFLLPPGWDASPSQGYPQALNLPVPIYTPGWREALWE